MREHAYPQDIAAIIGNVPWAQLPGIIGIPDGTDLNTLTSTADHIRESGTGVTTALNYPVGGAAGWLEVKAKGPAVYQRYTRRAESNTMYTRGYFNGTWYPWKAINAN